LAKKNVVITLHVDNSHVLFFIICRWNGRV